MDRREFIQTTAGAAAISTLQPKLPQADASIRDLCMRALNAAKTAGASYADVRVGRTRLQSVSTREQQITNLSDGETYGFGIRVLAQGAWGFAASRDLRAAEIDRVARLAATQAKANRRAMQRPITLAPTPAVKDGRWRSPIETDPFDVTTSEAALRKLAELQGVSAAKLIHPLRLALTGRGASPPIFDVAVVLGKDRTLRRLRRLIERLPTLT